MEHLRPYIFTGILLALSCAHTEGAQRPPAHAAASPATPVPAGRPATAPAAAPAADHEPITAFMADHFETVTWARDAVISGNLPALREPLQQLADYEYRTVAPGGWMPAIADLQQTARLTSSAENLDLAASGVAAMARVCGDCHRERAPRAKFADMDPEAKRKRRDSMGERMERHFWAADRMWQGLIEPSDAAWHEGADALAHLPDAAPKGATDPQIAAALREVRAIGERALESESARDRADTYGLFLATCANCHSHVAVDVNE